jgi:hypothetical protein
MLKDYGDAYCEGRSGPIGIDGWYANGQTYAYLQGELGVKVNLLFVKKKIPVIKGGAAALLQAKLPNPSWFSGYLGVKFDLLGGLVKGNMRMKITLGEECEIVMPESQLSDMLDMEVIGDITPNDRMSDVDVFSSPQAAFNMRIDKTFTFDDAGSKSYRIKLDKFSVTQNGSPLDGELKWNYDKNVVSFLPHEILPSQKELKIVVSIVFEEYKNGYWITVKEDNKILSESKEITFTTGVAPDVIPPQNIAYCYPVIDQKYFFTGESAKGYVQLKQGQAYLFSSDMHHEIHFLKGNGITQKISLTYNSAAKRIEYTMSGIEKSSSYTFDIVSFAEASESNRDTERRKTVELSTDDKENNSVSMRDAKAGDAIQGDAGKNRLSYTFATSAYSTLKEKVESITKTDPYVWRYGENADEKDMGSDWYLQYNINGGEPFDVAELVGVTNSSNKPLIDVYATLSDNYYKSKIKPLLYTSYPLNGITFTHRNPDIFGVPPARAVMLLSKYLTAVEQGNLTGVVKQIFPFRYDLSRVYHQDFSNLRERVTNKYLHTEQYKNYAYLMNASFPQLDYGDYEIQLRYVFPDGTKGSIGKFTYFNALR